MIFGQTSYRDYLRSVLSARVSSNPAYSLRAMARSLGVVPSQLSGVLAGKRHFSFEAALKVSDRIGLKGVEAEYFSTLWQYENARSHEWKKALLDRLKTLGGRDPEIRDLSVDAFVAISEWYHLPILEMLSLTRFEFTPKNIAKRLGISLIQASTAIERLERLELIEKSSKGKYQRTVGGIRIESLSSNEALRKFHRQMIEKAIQSLTEQDNREKWVGSETMSIDPEQLPEAAKLVERSLAAIRKLFRSGKNKTETYHIGVQLFRLTQGGKK